MKDCLVQERQYLIMYCLKETKKEKEERYHAIISRKIYMKDIKKNWYMVFFIVILLILSGSILAWTMNNVTMRDFYFMTIPYQDDNFVQVSKSPNISEEQGVATDGTYLYTFGTNHIKKYDMDWNLIKSNPNAGAQSNKNHLGDGVYYNNKLYVATMNIIGGCNSNSYAISIWDSSDLSYVGTIDISAQNFHVSGIFADLNTLYIISFCDGTKILKYDRSNYSYIGSISLNPTLANIQGITIGLDGYFYITANSPNNIYKVDSNGTILHYFWSSGIYNELEGIDYTTNLLYFLNSEYSQHYIYVLQKTILNSDTPDHKKKL